MCVGGTETTVFELLGSDSTQHQKSDSKQGWIWHRQTLLHRWWGWICPAWNLRNRLVLVLSSLCCLLRIWPFERSVSWYTLELCRWVGIWAKSSNTSQPQSYLKEQHHLFCLWLTCCHSSVAFCIPLSLISAKVFCWDPKAHVWFQRSVMHSDHVEILVWFHLTSFKCSSNSYLIFPIALY